MSISNNRWLRRVGLVAVVVVAFLAGLSLQHGREAHDSRHAADGEQPTTWTCSMHPQIQLPKSGQCPICGMDLIPLVSSGGLQSGPASLTLSPAARTLAEIQTSPVVRRAVETSLRTVGKLEADETRIREISAWVPGRIDRLYIDYTGVPVRAGQKLFDLYSPELFSAQQELLQAINAAGKLTQSSLESTRRSANRTIEASRERLRLWGLTKDQIDKIEERGTASDHVTIAAPMSGIVLHKDALEGSYVQTGTHVYAIADLSVLWLKLDVYESDLALVELDQRVEFETDTYPGELFEGAVAFIDPVLNERSRSVKVRVNVKNRDGRLKPGMFARAVVQAEIKGHDGELPLVIPASAPLVTGTRAVVYVENPHEPGRYHGREVVLGPRAGDHYVVRDGLVEGERVVSNGSFKIDSALQILAKRSMMNPEGGGVPPGHDHGASTSPTLGSSGSRALAGVSRDFRLQLDEVLGRYFGVSHALSHDDLGAAQQAAAALRAALSAVDPGLLPVDGQRPWDEASGALERSSVATGAAQSLAAARSAFYDLSVAMIGAARVFGGSGRIAALVYHCPMARDGAGADWLQSKPGTENPYYGSTMFDCGSETETIIADSETTSGHEQH